MQENRTNQPNLVVNALNPLLNENVDLQELARKFPYSLPIQALVSSVNKSQNYIDHNKFLRLSAVISPDRTWLYNYIEGYSTVQLSQEQVHSISQDFEIQNIVVHQNEPEVALEEKSVEELQYKVVADFDQVEIYIEEPVVLPEQNLYLNDSIDDQVIEDALADVQVPYTDEKSTQEPIEDLKMTVSPQVDKQPIQEPFKQVKLEDQLEKELLKVAVDKTIQQEVDELVKELPEIQKELPKPETNQPDSFGYWLNPAKSKIESREDKLKKIDALIEKFIKSEPRIAPKKVEFYSPLNVAKQSVAFNEDLVSEPLAAIFEKQGYFDKAIKAYEKLSLKFPEKRAYFAARIEKIGEIIKNIKNTK